MTSKTPWTDGLAIILDKVFTPETTILGRVLTLIVMFSMIMIWYKGEALMEVYKSSKFEDYQEIINSTRIQSYEVAAIEQLQIAYVSSGADFGAIYEYRPKNINNFYSMITYEGEVPKGVDLKSVSGHPIDKTSIEYRTQLTGSDFSSTDHFDFLPTSQKVEIEMGFLFSCPIFNLDNIYSGMVSLMWKEKPLLIMDDNRLGAICGQAARTLGRLK